MATTTANFDKVEECFNRVYEQLREDNNENAPNSFTWYAPTFRELAAQRTEMGLSFDFDPDNATPIGNGEAVAWVYECNGENLYRIGETASENALITLFGGCMGYDL